MSLNLSTDVVTRELRGADFASLDQKVRLPRHRASLR